MIDPNRGRGHVLCLGAGYTAQYLAKAILPEGWLVSGTTRQAEKAHDLSALGITPLIWEDFNTAPLHSITEIIVSMSPREGACPALNWVQEHIQSCPNVRAIIYYSSTGVYGDHKGEWVDETTPLTSTLPRAIARQKIERAWQTFAETQNLPCFILRLSGIYGPNRNAVDNLQNPNKKIQRVYKEGQIFNRIHVADIAHATKALLERVSTNNLPENRIYNFADDLPSPPQDVIAYAAELLGLPTPQLIPFEQADLSPMARSFYADSKRIKNEWLKKDLLPELAFPDYKAGLGAVAL